MSNHNSVSYIEFPSTRLSETKAFFTGVFGWSFVDYGDEYTSFTNAGVDGGFFAAGSHPSHPSSSVLIVLYSNDLEATLGKVKDEGCTITKEIFSFPGGRRFHFVEPGGNELAVWSEDKEDA